MCNIDVGSDSGFDIGSDFDISEETDLGASSDIDSGSSFEGLDDIDGAEGVSDTLESFDSDGLDIEVGIERVDDYPSLDEFDIDEMLVDAHLDEGIPDTISETAEEISETEYEEPQLDFSQIEDVGSEMISTEYLEGLESENADEEEDVKVLTREITTKVLESRERDTEEVLDNYRENLQNRGIPEERIEEFVNQERDKINAEYESLDRGELSSNIYQEPTDWEAVANSLTGTGEDIRETSDAMEEVSLSELSDVAEEIEAAETPTEKVDAEDIAESLNIDVPEEVRAEEGNNEFDFDNANQNQELDTIGATIDNERIGESEGTERANDTPDEAFDENVNEEIQEPPTDYEESYEEIDQEIDDFDDIDAKLKDVPTDADEINGLLRDVLDQNVSEQRLLSDSRVEWSEPEERGNSDCILRDDAEFTVKYKSNQEKVTYTGAEFKQHMLDEYGIDIVSYSHKEPDFAPFEQTFDKDKLEEFLSEKHGRKIELDAIPEGHVEVEQMGTDRNDTYGAAYDYCIDVLGSDVTKRDLQEFMSENDLTWHECGDRKTIRLVPSEINQVFAHTGGIGIEKDFEAMRSEMMDNLNDSNGDKGGFKLQRKDMGGMAEGLDSAIKWKHNRYSERKSEMFGHTNKK